MTASLTPEQVEHYWTAGFVSGLPVLTADEAADFVARLEAVEAEQAALHGGSWDKRDFRPWEQDDHPLRDWLDALARHPRVLDAVESVLGPDILVRNCDVFIKNGDHRRGIGWHQDTAEQGEDADCLLTVWLGLTPATVDNGALQFCAGSHRMTIPGGPKDRFTLTFTKEAAAHLPADATFTNVMAPGQMSMHHFRTAHRSGPNRTQGRRIAFVGRYMATRISQATAESGQAVLVRGHDTHKHFALKERFPMTWTM